MTEYKEISLYINEINKKLLKIEKKFKKDKWFRFPTSDKGTYLSIPLCQIEELKKELEYHGINLELEIGYVETGLVRAWKPRKESKL